MSMFGTFFLHHEYGAIVSRGDRLGEIGRLLDWESFRPLLTPVYQSDGEQRGHPHTDVIVLMKLLVLQQWYGLSDYELERQAGDRISFRHFLGFSATSPDRSTIWLFKNRLVEAGVVDALWTELQHQLDARGLTIRRGVIQDATFFTADPGHAPAEKPRGERHGRGAAGTVPGRRKG